MWFVLFFATILWSSVNAHKIRVDRGTELATCVSSILAKYISNVRPITYVDINSDEDLLKGLDDDINFLYVSRTPDTKFSMSTGNYLIHAANVANFTAKFHNLVKDSLWNPKAKFLIILNDIAGGLKDVFDTLLQFHVLKVVVVDASRSDMNLFTYEPFANFSCGKRYDGIIPYGKCLTPDVTNFFPKKLPTGLRNCTFNVEASHWPPFAADPHVVQVVGVEQFIFKVLSEYEHFHINYSFYDSAEFFSQVNPDMTVAGPLKRLQLNQLDINMGGMILHNSRAQAFDYIWSHMAFTDEIVTLVKQARGVAIWKYIYVEFPTSVWALLFATFVIYSVLMIVGFNITDKSSFVLKMFDTLICHGINVKLPKKCVARFVLIQWVWFACLIGMHYQTSLTSLNTSPVYVYQIAKQEDLDTYKLKSCVSRVMRMVLWANADEGKPMYHNYENYTHGCDRLLESIGTVSDTEEAFTITFNSVYKFYKHKYYDSFGSKVYTFKQPLNKLIYGIYFYKGFPRLHEMHERTLRMGEGGLINKALNDIFLSSKFDAYRCAEEVKSTFVVPWNILLFGSVLASVVFVIEVVVGRSKNMAQNADEDYFIIDGGRLYTRGYITVADILKTNKH